ncbi:hypothetical protein [Shewanella sp. 10N.286.54.B9]|uniref:hypothetical protein n=1 Tax=Shewanella sp. 10N.286.54.B9 TaxID=3229719 RepID=UPI003553FB6C
MKYFLLLTLFLVISFNNVRANECDTLSEKEGKLRLELRNYIEHREIPKFPRDELIFQESLKEGRDGLIECIIVRFTVDASLSPVNFKILNSSYNRQFSRSSVQALKKYRFKGNAKNKSFVEVFEFKIEQMDGKP